ncbi:thioredoxin domain-containing protein [Leptospira bandrabouensis]|uniref:vitamin K epoxide reductase/DsbA family protein n=1 Tax=Leptospira bandrabouensis TaxID=2484903 RepID=UPI00223C8F40|nr:thioredoxin domain-containing protein [Leptospira bandrabouensis]MCW7460115.1 thioredoxin domain-containing protein [Leptospira bandrabouensis]MCW7477067.1 thioredoxin domain-containing protein [Leptospira bandrabouensis]MCW7484749.1 thioredoxin domain-containing protein [Leptospira bandrabouensis]
MNRKNLALAGVIGGAIGLIVSFLLAIEYFGIGTENVASSACSALGGGDSCLKVAESSYSAIPGVPFLGNVPIALLGFGFYGLITYSFFLVTRAKSNEEVSNFISLLFPILVLGLVFDFILLGISVGIIGTICQLCFITYIVTIALLVILFLLWKTEGKPTLNFPLAIKDGMTTAALVYFFTFSLGFATSKMWVSGSNSNTLATSRGMDSAEIQTKIAAYFQEPTLGIKVEGYPFIGKKEAPITIVKYADYNCGHCMHTSHILHTVLSEYDGMVRVVYKNFPLDGTCNRLMQQPRPGATSCVAAIAAICADKQGKFEPMYRGLYDNLEKGVAHSGSSVVNLANSIGLNVNSLKACMASKEAQNQLNAEIDEAEKLNIQSTPSLYVNDRKIESGTPNPIFLKSLLEQIIQKM